MQRWILFIIPALVACQPSPTPPTGLDPRLEYQAYSPDPTDITLSRAEYMDRLYGFWLGQCIANWTGLITEMDKIGGDGLDGRGAGFYTEEDWGGPDQPNIWSTEPSHLSKTIDFYLEPVDSVWGADDDTDIEYMYQHLLYVHETTRLSPEQIRDGWLTHIYSDSTTPFTWGDGKTPENYLWVSNQQAFDLMEGGMLPPETSDSVNNPYFEMIDAQLTTEIFGLFNPLRPDLALEAAKLPIRTTAAQNAQWISEFYVIMYSLALWPDEGRDRAAQLKWMADQARQRLPNDSYAADMYDQVKSWYEADLPWEAARDSVHERYQVRQAAGYTWSTRDQACNGCFAAGVNFAGSLVSLFYGEGNIRKTIKIGALTGWDSDNPTATWGGLIGFMLGKAGVERAFGGPMADQFNIHRTRGNFPSGIDTFEEMARKGTYIVDRVVQQDMQGGIDPSRDRWYIPLKPIDIYPPQP